MSICLQGDTAFYTNNFNLAVNWAHFIHEYLMYFFFNVKWINGKFISVSISVVLIIINVLVEKREIFDMKQSIICLF